MSEPMPWHLTKLKNIDYNRVDLVKEGANSQAFIKLFKSKGGNTMNLEEILKLMKPEHSEVIQKALKDLEDALEVAKAAKKDDTKDENNDPTDSDDMETMMKSIKDPVMKKFMEEQIAKTKAAEAFVLKMKEEKDEQEAVAKAKELTGIGAEEAKLAEVYKKLKNTDEQLCTDVFGIFKAAQALASQGGAFQEIGKGTEGKDQGLTEAAAWSQIEAKAEEIGKARNINKSAAITAAINENPDLYAQYLKSQQ